MGVSIYSMGEYLQSEDVTEVAMESTGIYWIAVWDLFFEMGFSLTLVNPFLIRQMQGRKSDAKDAQWIIVELLYKGMMRGSFVSSPLIQELRIYSRKYHKLQRSRLSCQLSLREYKNKQSGRLKESLTDNMKEHHHRQLLWIKQEYDMYQCQIAECLKEMQLICDDNFALAVKLLQTIPAAMAIIAETGGDMSVFENS